MSEYEIGTSVGALTSVAALLSTLHVNMSVKGMAVEPYSVYRTAVSGREYGDGYPRTTWTFSYLTPAMLDDLMDYVGTGNQSGVVYIRTCLTDRTWAIYKAFMHRPKLKQEMTWEGGWRDVTIRFTHLEEQEEPPA